MVVGICSFFLLFLRSFFLLSFLKLTERETRTCARAHNTSPTHTHHSTAGHDVNTENELLRQKVLLLEKENANLKEQLKKLTGGVKAAIGEAKAKDAAINGK